MTLRRAATASSRAPRTCLRGCDQLVTLQPYNTLRPNSPHLGEQGTGTAAMGWAKREHLCPLGDMPEPVPDRLAEVSWAAGPGRLGSGHGWLATRCRMSAPRSGTAGHMRCPNASRSPRLDPRPPAARSI